MSPQEPGKATLLAIFEEIKATRHDINDRLEDHEIRIRAVERKRTLAAAVSGAVASVIVALIVALSGCTPQPRPAAMTRAATEQIQGLAVGPYGLSAWTGTAWAIAENGPPGHEISVFATAGHVCNDGAIYVLSDGRMAETIYETDLPPMDDICLLVVKGPSEPLRVAKRDPGISDKVSYTGYPSGVRGTYHGEVEDVGEDGTLLLSIPGYFGASGSAVVNSRGRVIGLVSMGDMRFTHHVWASGVASLRRAQDFADSYLTNLRLNPLGD